MLPIQEGAGGPGAACAGQRELSGQASSPVAGASNARFWGCVQAGTTGFNQ